MFYLSFAGSVSSWEVAGADEENVGRGVQAAGKAYSWSSFNPRIVSSIGVAVLGWCK